MSDMESIETTDGELSQPAQTSSKGTADNTSAVDLGALTKALEPLIEKAVEKQWQSGKDSRFAKVEKHEQQMTEFESQLARLQELSSKGVSQEDALWRMKVESRLGGNVPASPEVKVGSQTEVVGAAKVELDAIVKMAGLDPGDKDVAEIYQKYPDDTLRQISELTTLGIKRQQSNQVNANPAQLQSVGSTGKILSQPTSEEILAEMDKLMQYPSRNKKRIDELAKEYDKLNPPK
jgi:hypothetical protein